ncbi:MAG: hypothetical protein LBT31_03450 [Synergistaceae bacterium]|nr:hypothetical protein [Synergistaceae bacterium]
MRLRIETELCVKERALRRLSVATLALFFCMPGTAALGAASGDIVPLTSYNAALAGYVLRMILALALLGGAGWAAAKFLPRRFRGASKSPLRLLAALGVGRDVVYILQAGPDVIALFVGKTGSTLLGKWSVDEWEDYEASSGEGARSEIEGGE